MKTVICLTDGDTAEVHATVNVTEMLRHRLLVPVAAIDIEPEAFLRVSGFLRLPTTDLPLERAAAVFARVGVAPSAQRAVTRHIGRLGPGRVVPALRAWAVACEGAA